MAHSSRRITRKDLRQPDWFQVATENTLAFYRLHPAKVLAAGAAFVVLLLAIWGWQLFRERQNASASGQFAQASALYQTGRFREALAGFEKVAAYRWSRYAGLAHLYQANSLLALDDFDKAIGSAQRFIAATQPDSLYRQVGLLTLAYAEERKGLFQSAGGNYGEAAKITGPFGATAMLGRARCAELAGDNNAALAAYKDYLREQPASPISLRVAELEAKAAARPAAK